MRLEQVGSILRAGWRFARRRERSPQGRSLACGTLGGLYLLTFCHQFTAAFGTALPAATALAIALALGVRFGWGGVDRRSAGDRRETLLCGLMHFALAGWYIVLPWLIEGVMAALGRVPLGTLASPGTALLLLTAAAILLLAPPVFWISRLPALIPPSIPRAAPPHENAGSPIARTFVQNRRGREGEAPGSEVASKGVKGGPGSRPAPPCEGGEPASRHRHRSYLTGIAAGVLLDVFLLAPYGVQLGGLIAAFGGGIVFLTCLARVSRSGSAGEAPGMSANTAASQIPVTSAQPAIGSPRESRTSSAGLWERLVICCAGGLTAAVLRAAQQLMPMGSYLVYVEWAALLGGWLLGVLWAGRGGAERGSLAGRACLGVAAVAALVLTAFPLLIDASLALNAFVSHVGLMKAARSLLIASLVLPIGVGLGVIAGGRPGKMNRPAAGTPHLHAATFLAGFLLARWFGFANVAPSDLLVGTAWLLAGLAAIEGMRSFKFERVPQEPNRVATPGDSAERHRGRSLQTRRTTVHGDSVRRRLDAAWIWIWTKRAAVAAAVGLVVAAPVFRRNYDPVRAARQLFATNVFVARQAGLEPELLSFLDEGRNVAALEGERGTYTLWRYLGTQLQVRESGVPKAIVSTRPRLCPQFTAELMQAALPLALHEHPHRVLVLGLGGGVPLTTCLGFPVQRLTCVEGDRALVELVGRHVWSESGEAPLADDRVRLVELDPVLALASRGGEYDVIISSPDQSALFHSTPCFTLEFYRRAEERLSEDGIFCQRFHQVDYGPMPLAVVVRTMQAVFRDVAAVEIATGEVALLGTSSPEGLFRPGLVERFQAPHVRQALSQVGWDWSVPLNLPAYGNRELHKFAEELSAGLNTCANGRFAFRLPQEVMRWGSKSQETYAVLARHQGRIAEWSGVDGADPELLRRLSEVTGQRRLMTAYPDQPWAYRKQLRRQVTERPRTLVRTVSGGDSDGNVHPEDRRRLRYFSVLDEAARSRSADEILGLAAFEHPYDPLMSYFVHHEIASLMSGSPDRDVRAELRHRLHAIYFADPRDRSVRNVAATLTLLCEHPESLDEPLDRWDHLSALMQVMKTRWTTRGLVQPKSTRLVLNDIEHSLSAIELALIEMGELRGELGFPESDWQARRAVIEQSLLRPLKTYRNVLIKHHRQERLKTKRLLELSEQEDRERATTDVETH